MEEQHEQQSEEKQAFGLITPTVKSVKREMDWITLFTFALVVVGSLQWSVMREQAELTRKALQATKESVDIARQQTQLTRDALETTKKSIEIAKEQTQLTRGTLKATQKSVDIENITNRPFLFVNHLVGDINQDNIEVMTEWQNSGNAPALHLIHREYSKVFYSDKSLRSYTWPELDKNLGSRPSKGRIGFIAAKATIEGGALKIPLKLMVSKANVKPRLFVWGYAEYEDISQKLLRHRTEFCSEIPVERDPDGNVTYIQPKSPQCNVHNTAI